MKLNCIIVDDEPFARKLLKEYVQKLPYLNLLNDFGNPLKALDFLRDNAVDILFLDVQMSELTGISLLKILKNKPAVILTTAYSEYAIEGYELEVSDYLLKPITFERFLKSVERVSQKITTQKLAEQNEITENQTVTIIEKDKKTPNFIFVKDGRKLIKVRFNDIQYIEGLKDYVKIHTAERNITTLQRLKNLEEELPKNQFIRVHHSYIVSVEWIEEIERERIKIGKQIIPISDTYRKSFQAFIDERQF